MNKLVGQRIMAARTQLGITRTAFAEMLGIPYTTLRNYEKGDREIGHLLLIKISQLLGVSIDYLLGLTESSAQWHPTEQKNSPMAKFADEGEDGRKAFIDALYDMSEQELLALLEIVKAVKSLRKQ